MISYYKIQIWCFKPFDWGCIATAGALITLFMRCFQLGIYESACDIDALALVSRAPQCASLRIGKFLLLYLSSYLFTYVFIRSFFRSLLHYRQCDIAAWLHETNPRTQVHTFITQGIVTISDDPQFEKKNEGKHCRCFSSFEVFGKISWLSLFGNFLGGKNKKSSKGKIFRFSFRNSERNQENLAEITIRASFFWSCNLCTSRYP